MVYGRTDVEYVNLVVTAARKFWNMICRRFVNPPNYESIR